MKAFGLRLFRFIVLFVVLTGGLLMSFDGALIYYPTRYPDGNWQTQGRGPCTPDDVYFTASDGVKTHGWFLKNPSSDKVLVYYHGNAGSIADRFEWGCMLTQVGVSVLMVEYRGYGRSEGKPGEKAFYRDSESVWSWLTGTAGYSQNQIILYGKSLGGAVATDLATRHEPAALILQSTFTSIPHMAKKLIPGVPGFLVPTKMASVEKLPDLGCPVMVVHSQQDEIVPFEMGRALASQAKNLYRFLEFQGYGHNDLVAGQGTELVRAFRELIETL